MSANRTRIAITGVLLLLSLALQLPAMAQIAQVEKTGQTTCWDTFSRTAIACAGTGQDGELAKGVSLPNPRFTDNGNGTVTDNLTGLIWLRNANCFGARTWSQALTDANFLASGNCELTDSSLAGNWRLPNAEELFSLVDYGEVSPTLSAGHPFSGVQSTGYWSSTSCHADPSFAWFVILFDGDVNTIDKASSGFVWPVRGGQ